MSTKQNPRIKKLAAEQEAKAAGDLTPPPFPAEMLPPVLREIAVAVAELHRVPVAMTAPMVLAVASASLGKGVMARASTKGKLTPPNIYVFVGKQSGTGGSSAFHALCAPLVGMEGRIMREFAKSVRPKLMSRMHELNVSLECCKTALRKGKTNDGKTVDDSARAEIRTEMERIERELQRIENDLQEPLLITQDVTPEQIGRRMASNGECIAQFSPEGAGALETALGKYQNKASGSGVTLPTFWTSAYSCEPYKSDRTNKGILILDSPCLSVLLLMTPDTLRRYLSMESLMECGFLARALFCDPRATMQVAASFDEAMQKREIPTTVSQTYEAAIWKALAIFRKPRGLESDEFLPPDDGAEDGKPAIVECELEAMRAFYEDEKRMCEAWKLAEELPQEFIARLTENGMRLALILHVFKHMKFTSRKEGIVNAECDAVEHHITAETAREALAMRDSFQAHSKSYLMPQKRAARDGAFARLHLLAEKFGWHLKGITPHDVLTHKIAGVKDSPSAVALLESWRENGELEKRERKHVGTGRKPSPAYFFPSWRKRT